MCSQAQRFTAKQVGAPQTVLRLTEKGQPIRTARSGLWPVMFSKNPSHDVLVDVHAEGQRNLLGNSRTTPSLGYVVSFQRRHRSILWPVPSDPAELRAWTKTACDTFVSSVGDPIKGDVKSKFFSLPSSEKWMFPLQPALLHPSPLQPAPTFL